MNNIDKKEIGRYLIAGFLAVATDMTVYYFLINFYPYSISKSISFISGTCVAYVINKYWTFDKKEKSLREATKFAILYSSSLLVNVGINKLFLTLLPKYVMFAFLMATGTSIILNFVGQKWWVFKHTEETI